MEFSMLRRSWRLIVLGYIVIIWAGVSIIYSHADFSKYHPPPGGNLHSIELGFKCHRQRYTAIRLAAFFGPWGLDQFYAHNWILAYCKLVTLGGLGLWWLLDVVLWIHSSIYDVRGCLAALS
ncbi:hypothetical protein V8C42DRAFT_337862 [Trichoderma barbatum]